MTEPFPPEIDAATHIAAWSSAMDDFVTLVAGLDDADWATPTVLPGWTVADVVAHVGWLEMVLLGEQDPPHEPDWAALPHITSDFGRATEIPVDLRRTRSREEVVAELVEARDRRVIAVGEGPQDVAAEVAGPFGPRPLGRVLRMRTLDTWVHEQDIRWALGLPTTMESAGARLTATVMIEALPMIWGKKVGAGPGEVLGIAVTGPGVVFDLAVGVGEDGRAGFVDEATEPTVRLSMPWETFLRICAGRADAASLRDSITVEGDAQRAEQFLAAAVVTP